MRSMIILMILSSGLGSSLFAQKKMLQHDDYDHWKSIRGAIISPDANWAAYCLRPGLGDPCLVLYNAKTSKNDSFFRGENQQFSYDSRFLAYTLAAAYDSTRKAKLAKKKKDDLPKNGLGIVALSTRESEVIPRVKSWKMAQKGSDWLAYLHEKPLEVKTDSLAKPDSSEEQKDYPAAKSKKKGKPGKAEKNATQLTIRHLTTKKEWHFPKVGSYGVSKNGARFYFYSYGDSVNQKGLYVFSTESQEALVIYKGDLEVEKPTWDEEGQQLAFYAKHEKPKDREAAADLFYWQAGMEKASELLSSQYTSEKDWWLNAASGIEFSKSGERIIIGTAPRPAAWIKDSTVLDEERPKLDVWSHHDPLLQPQQLKRLSQEKERGYKAWIDLKTKKLVQLSTQEIPGIRISNKGDGLYAIGKSGLPYRKQRSWDWPGYEDIYVVNAKSGASKVVERQMQGRANISPDGQYLYWYNMADSNWHAYHIKSGKRRNLTASIPQAFFDEEDDHPQLPYAYGAAGWTEKDKYLVVYDAFDLWRLDPSGKEKPLNLTQHFGRLNKIRLRVRRLDPEKNTLDDDLLLGAFNKETMASGYYRAKLNTAGKPKKLIMLDKRMYIRAKAKKSDALLLSIESTSEYPDLYLTDMNLSSPAKLSSANPQQADYNWANVELISYRGANGEELKGLLYTPENLDESKRYPLLVYFYERYSNLLHRHHAPRPSRSTINFSFYASRGYAVFVPDIVYRDGRPGRSAYDCIVPGVLHLLAERPYLNANKVGLQGQSWGGYQTAYLVTQTNLFRAGMAGAPVSNMTSAYGGIRWGSGMSRAFQYEKSQSRIGGSLWEKPLAYLENSPLFYADKVETPLLMMHNDNDGAVPWYQGIEYFNALRRLEKPVWMLVYNGEEHNLTKRPNQVDLSIRMQQFFDHYLMGSAAPVWMKKGIPATEKGRTLGYDLVKEKRR